MFAQHKKHSDHLSTVLILAAGVGIVLAAALIKQRRSGNSALPVEAVPQPLADSPAPEPIHAENPPTDIKPEASETHSESPTPNLTTLLTLGSDSQYSEPVCPADVNNEGIVIHINNPEPTDCIVEKVTHRMDPGFCGFRASGGRLTKGNEEVLVYVPGLGPLQGTLDKLEPLGIELYNELMKSQLIDDDDVVCIYFTEDQVDIKHADAPFAWESQVVEDSIGKVFAAVHHMTSYRFIDYDVGQTYSPLTPVIERSSRAEWPAREVDELEVSSEEPASSDLRAS
jgi:hypothetical protein